MSETIEGEAVEEVDEIRDRLPAVQHHAAVVARDEITVAELVAQRDKIVQAMDAAMTDGVHYGKIPGVNRPTLLKPGAELLNVLLRLAPSYQSERTFHDDGHLTVVSYCTLTHIPSGLVISAGEGLCSTRESKYAYRNAERVCPECGEAQVRKGKARGNQPGNWYCWKKMGGCGATWPLDGEQAQAFEAMETGKVPNPDLADSYNTVLKMADKRALIAAVLNGTAASDVFTQDVEDTQGSGDSGASTAPSAPDPGGAERVAAPAESPVALPPSFPPGPDLGERIGAALEHVDNSVDWRATWENANRAKYGKPRADLPPREKGESLHRLAIVAAKLGEGPDFPPPVSSEIAGAFEVAFETNGVIEVVYHEAAPLSDHAQPDADEDIPFGED